MQPTCTTPTGTIAVSAPIGTTIQYSNGGAYQVGTTFAGLAPSDYNITAQDMTTGCISTVTVLTVNAIPTATPTPTASVTVQPTCTTPTGTIVVAAPIGATIQYSNGGAYQVGTTFSGLAPGNYNITAQDMQSLQNNNYNVFAEDARPILLKYVIQEQLTADEKKYFSQPKTLVNLSVNYQSRPEFNRIISTVSYGFKFYNKKGLLTYDIVPLETYVVKAKLFGNFCSAVKYSGNSPKIRAANEISHGTTSTPA